MEIKTGLPTEHYVSWKKAILALCRWPVGRLYWSGKYDFFLGLNKRFVYSTRDLITCFQ